MAGVFAVRSSVSVRKTPAAQGVPDVSPTDLLMVADYKPVKSCWPSSRAVRGAAQRVAPACFSL